MKPPWFFPESFIYARLNKHLNNVYTSQDAEVLLWDASKDYLGFNLQKGVKKKQQQIKKSTPLCNLVLSGLEYNLYRKKKLEKQVHLQKTSWAIITASDRV